MTREDMLARLIAQAGYEGGELITLRAIVEAMRSAKHFLPSNALPP